MQPHNRHHPLKKISNQALLAMLALLAAGFGQAAAVGTPTLSSADPYRLTMDPAGKSQRVNITGTDFENDGHQNRDEYMHWQIRRDDGGWEPCAQWSSKSGAVCRGTGWSNNLQELEIGGKYLTREGFVELRAFASLAGDHETDPSVSPYKQASSWSNVIRIPVVTPGPQPTITTLSRKEFPTNGKPDDYRFFIEGTNLGKQPVVVFRGDTVVWPERVIGGNRIQVSVPQNYRLTSPGEISFTIRTDKGGNSAPKYIRFVPAPKLTPLPAGAVTIKPNLQNLRKLP
jgi:hypothetical protein